MNIQQKILSPIALIIIVILGLAITMVTIKIESRIVSDFSNSKIVEDYNVGLNNISK